MASEKRKGDGVGLKVALCLLTCDREAVTKKTIESLKKHVPLDRFILLHGDDASRSEDNCRMAQAAGFESVVKNKGERRGVTAMWRSLVSAARKRGADWVLMQENDWEWVRDYPDGLIEHVHDNDRIYYIRLFGVNKERDGRPCGARHAAKKDAMEWREYEPLWGWEIGDIHWGFPPNFTRIKYAEGLLRAAKAESHCRKRSGKINALALRPKSNYVYHIGKSRTKGFKQ